MQYIFAIVVLALNIWALVMIWQADSALPARILWTIGILLAPLIGFVVWFLFGSRSRSRIAV